MVLYIRLLSHDAEDFVMELAVDSSVTFMTLHLFIQKVLNYDTLNMASFVITDNDWERLKEVSMMKMNEDDEDVVLMEDTRLGDLLKYKKQRLMYVFDFFSERAFFMEVFDIKEGELKEPKLLKKEGKVPDQISIDDSVTGIGDIATNDPFEHEHDPYDDGYGDEFDDFESLDPDNLPDDY